MKLIDKEQLLEDVKKRHYTSSSIKLIEDQKEIDAIPIKWLKKCKASDLTVKELVDIKEPYVYDVIVMLIDEYEEYVKWNQLRSKK